MLVRAQVCESCWSDKGNNTNNLDIAPGKVIALQYFHKEIIAKLEQRIICLSTLSHHVSQ